MHIGIILKCWFNLLYRFCMLFNKGRQNRSLNAISRKCMKTKPRKLWQTRTPSHTLLYGMIWIKTLHLWSWGFFCFFLLLFFPPGYFSRITPLYLISMKICYKQQILQELISHHRQLIMRSFLGNHLWFWMPKTYQEALLV